MHTQFGLKIKSFQCDNGIETIVLLDISLTNMACLCGFLFLILPLKIAKPKEKSEPLTYYLYLLHHVSIPPSFSHHAPLMATYILKVLPSN